MKHAIWISALACAFVVIGVPKFAVAQRAKPAVPEYGSILAETLKDWSDLKESLLKLGDFMPADKYDFILPFPAENLAVNPVQESFGRRVLRIAQVNVVFLAFLGGKATPPPEPSDNMTSKEASTKAVKDSFDYGTAVLKEQTDQSMLQVVNASFLGRTTRARVVSYLIGHAREVDGQMVLYLRMAGIGLPVSQ